MLKDSRFKAGFTNVRSLHCKREKLFFLFSLEFDADSTEFEKETNAFLVRARFNGNNFSPARFLQKNSSRPPFRSSSNRKYTIKKATSNRVYSCNCLLSRSLSIFVVASESSERHRSVFLDSSRLKTRFLISS